MTFEQKTWKDRVAEFINRRILTKEDGSTELVTVARSEGTVSQEGDGFTANNMNDLEQRIANAFLNVNSSLTASNGANFRFGVNAEGKYGYIITDEAGADTVIPFKAGSYPTVLAVTNQSNTLIVSGYNIVNNDYVEETGTDGKFKVKKSGTYRLNGYTQNQNSFLYINNAINSVNSNNYTDFELNEGDEIYIYRNISDATYSYFGSYSLVYMD